MLQLLILFLVPVTADTELLVSQIVNSSFWTALAPDLHIYDADFANAIEIFSIDLASSKYIQDMMRTEGYIQLDPMDFSVISLSSMVGIVEKLHSMGIPLPFCYLYDEFWLIFISVHNVIKEIMGTEYYRLPDFWSWRVDPAAEESGWRLHRDKNMRTVGADGMPDALTVWIPLTEATALNSCIYILPADRDPTYNVYGVDASTLPVSSVLGDFRALPAAAGSILMWNQQVWHYGSHASKRARQPRFSLAMEFQSPDIPPLNSPLAVPLSLPPFSNRLQLIAKQIIQYQHMYPLTTENLKIADDILNSIN